MELFCDDKFDVVIDELVVVRGWKRCPFQSSRAGLIFTNLRNVQWKKVTSTQLINHFQGSQHLSNKSFLAYHMAEHRKSSCMPMQWSAAYQDLGELVAMATLCSLLGAVHHHLSNPGEICTSSLVHDKVRDAKKLLRVLDMDMEMKDHEYVAYSKALLEALSSAEKNWEQRLSDIIKKLEIAGQLGSCAIGSQDVWIVKEVGSSCGKGITLRSGTRELMQCVREMSYKCIIQKYIERPLLLRSARKFDIRQWVLVTSLQPLQVYGFSEFYCRLSKRAYRLGSSSLDDKAMHLCNHVVQAADKGVGEEENMCTQEYLAKHLAGLSPGVSLEEAILPQIKHITLDAVTSAAASLTKVGQGFEWLGLDLMVSESMDVYLIEANVSPDITRSTPITTRLVEAATKGLCDLVLPNEGGDSGKSGEVEGPRWELWTETGNPARTGGDVFTPAMLKPLDKEYTAKKQHVYDRAVAALGDPMVEQEQQQQQVEEEKKAQKEEENEEEGSEESDDEL